MVRALGLLAFAVALSGCYNLRYYDSRVTGPGPTHKVWVHGFLLGFVTVGELDFAGECPGGVFKMRSTLSAGNVALGALTLGIYTPQTVLVTCGYPAGPR